MILLANVADENVHTGYDLQNLKIKNITYNWQKWFFFYRPVNIIEVSHDNLRIFLTDQDEGHITGSLWDYV